MSNITEEKVTLVFADYVPNSITQLLQLQDHL